MTDRDLTIAIPVLRRPHRVLAVLASARRATPAADVLFIASPDDVAEIEALERAGATFVLARGNYARKMNAAIEQTTSPLIFSGADDLEFWTGWFEAALEKMRGPIGVVGTNDLCNARVIAGEHSTHSLISREYARLGSIDDETRPFHEGYPHEYVDDEFIATAKHRGAYAHAHDAIVEHLHPDAGKAPTDRLYRARPARMRAGARVFARRKRLWA